MRLHATRRLGGGAAVLCLILLVGALAAEASRPKSASAGPRAPSVVSRGANTLVVWEDQRGGGAKNIYGARVSPAGKVLDRAGIAISTAPNSQLHPQVAFDGVNYFVVWTDDRPSDEQFDVYGTRVSRAGVVLDRRGIPIATGAKSEAGPSVAFDGRNFLVVWDDFRSGVADVYGARVSRTGAVLDRGGFAISRARGEQIDVRVAFDGTNYFVVWSDARTSDDYDLFGARVSRGGIVLDPGGIMISEDTGPISRPNIAYGGGAYLVAWGQWIGSTRDVFAMRISQAGSVLDPAGIRVSTAANDQGEARVAFDGRNYFVVWADGRGRTVDVYGSRVSRAGAVLDPRGRPVARAAGNQWVESVAFNGANYFVAWQKEPSSPYAADRTTNVYGARFSKAGVRLDRRSIPLPSAKRRSR